MSDAGDPVCASCGTSNRRKRAIVCATCGTQFHLSCVGITRAQAGAIGRWNCGQCRGISRPPVRAQAAPLDLVAYIGECRGKLRVLNRVPKGAIVPVAEALQRL